MKKSLKIIITLIYFIIFFKLEELHLENIIFFKKVFYLIGILSIFNNINKNKFIEIIFFLLNGIGATYIYKYTYFNSLTFLLMLSLFISFYFIILNIDIQNKIIKLILLFLLPYTIEKMIIYKFKNYFEGITLVNILFIILIIYNEWSEYRRKNVCKIKN
ncbi:hypothetical protein FV113G1_07450 [Fusobacterium varium]|nr:hypothetical protein FV113G1_07450 [Fusobacterium varium]